MMKVLTITAILAAAILSMNTIDAKPANDGPSAERTVNLSGFQNAAKQLAALER